MSGAFLVQGLKHIIVFVQCFCSAKIICLFSNKATKKRRAVECLSSGGSHWPSQPAVYGNLIRKLRVSSKLLCYYNQRAGEKMVWTS